MGIIGEYDDGEIKIEIGEHGMDTKVWHKGKLMETLAKVELIMEPGNFTIVKLYHAGIKKVNK